MVSLVVASSKSETVVVLRRQLTFAEKETMLRVKFTRGYETEEGVC